MHRINKILLVITILSLSLTTYAFCKDIQTVKKWQAKAWSSWHQDVAKAKIDKSATKPNAPESWWSKNPWLIAIYVWSATIKNWVLTAIGLVSAAFNSYSYVKGREYRMLLLKQGGSIASNVP